MWFKTIHGWHANIRTDRMHATIVQYKMILKRDLIPIQDDPENGRCRVGMPRGNAHQNAECRESNAVADRRVFEGQRRDGIRWRKPCRNVRLGAADARPSGIRPSGEEAARSDPRLPEQSDGAEPGADHATDPGVSRDRSGRGKSIPPAELCDQVQEGGYCAAGGSGSRARTAERARHATDSETRARRVRPREICASGGDLRFALVQLASQYRLPEGGGGGRGEACQP